MANLSKLTNDENLILLLLIARDVLIDLLSKKTGVERKTLYSQLGCICGKQATEFSDEEVRELIENVRQNNQQALFAFGYRDQ